MHRVDSSETVFFPDPYDPDDTSDTDALVTDTRAVLLGTTYAVASISSVRKHVIPPPPKQAGCAVWATLGVIVGISFGAGMFQAGDYWAGITMFAVSVVSIAGAIQFYRKWPSQTRYSVFIRTASGEHGAITSHDETKIDGIVGAISKAIIARG